MSQNEDRHRVEMKREEVNEEIAELHAIAMDAAGTGQSLEQEVEFLDAEDDMTRTLSLLDDLERMAERVIRQKRRFEAQLDELELAERQLEMVTADE